MSGLDVPWGIQMPLRLVLVIVSAAGEARTEQQRQMQAQSRADAQHRKVEAAVAKFAASQAEAVAAIRAQRGEARLAKARDRRTAGRAPR